MNIVKLENEYVSVLVYLLGFGCHLAFASIKDLLLQDEHY